MFDKWYALDFVPLITWSRCLINDMFLTLWWEMIHKWYVLDFAPLITWHEMLLRSLFLHHPSTDHWFEFQMALPLTIYFLCDSITTTYDPTSPLFSPLFYITISSPLTFVLLISFLVAWRFLSLRLIFLFWFPYEMLDCGIRLRWRIGVRSTTCTFFELVYLHIALSPILTRL